MDKATCGRKITELLHGMRENRTYVSLKDLVLDRTVWKQESRESVSRTCRKQQRTKQRETDC